MKLDRLPSLLEYYSYCFASGNLLAGPFFEAKEYFDFIERKVGVWRKMGRGGVERCRALMATRRPKAPT